MREVIVRRLWSGLYVGDEPRQQYIGCLKGESGRETHV